jgi:hypothetical protein
VSASPARPDSTSASSVSFQGAAGAGRVHRVQSAPHTYRWIAAKVLGRTEADLFIVDVDPSTVAQAVLSISNGVTESRTLESQLIVSDRLASVGTLAAGVAHEINDPLAAVIANVDYIQPCEQERPVHRTERHAGAGGNSGTVGRSARNRTVCASVYSVAVVGSKSPGEVRGNPIPGHRFSGFCCVCFDSLRLVHRRFGEIQGSEEARECRENPTESDRWSLDDQSELFGHRPQEPRHL